MHKFYFKIKIFISVLLLYLIFISVEKIKKEKRLMILERFY